MIIYKTTNLINDKFYVGQHYTSANDGYLGSGKILLNAIKKYGKENFNREILEFVDENNIDEQEIYWIAHTSANVQYGNYNITSGGNKPPRWHNTKDAIYIKQKISITNKKVIHTKEWNKKVSEANKGKVFTKEHCNNISKSKKGKRNEKQIKLLKKYYKNEKNILRNRIQKTCVQIEIDGTIFQSIRHSARILNIPESNIRRRLKSKNFPNYKYV